MSSNGTVTLLFIIIWPYTLKLWCCNWLNFARYLMLHNLASPQTLRGWVLNFIEYYILITIVECDTGKYQEFIAEYCFECEARVTIPKAMNEWCFPGIAFYYGNNEFIVWQTCTMIGSYVATPPGNKNSISYVASNDDCPMIKWTNKKPTAEWNGCEQSQGDVLDN